MYRITAYECINRTINDEDDNMNNNDNDADFVAMSLTSNNELELQQVSAYSQESPTEMRIEHMLLSHSKYYVYCE